MSRVGVLAEEDAVGRLVRQAVVEEVRSVLRRLVEVEDVTEAERLDNPVEKAVQVARRDLLGAREERLGEEARLHERLDGDRLAVRLVEEEVLAVDDGGDAALGLVAEAGREALGLAVDGAEEEAPQPHVADRRDARQCPVLLGESDGPAHVERHGRGPLQIR